MKLMILMKKLKKKKNKFLNNYNLLQIKIKFNKINLKIKILN